MTKALVHEARIGREWDGAARVFDDRVFLVFQAQGPLGEDLPTFLPWCWEATFGASITVTVVQPHTRRARVRMAAGHPAADQLLGLPVTAIFADDSGPVSAYELDFAEQLDGAAATMKAMLEALASHTPEYRCPATHRAEMLAQAADMWPELTYSREHRASIAWFHSFRVHQHLVSDSLGKLAGDLLALPVNDLPQTLREPMSAFARTRDLSFLVSAVGAAVDADAWMDWFEAAGEIQRMEPWARFERLPIDALLLYMFSAEATNCGTRLPYVHGPRSCIAHIELDLQAIEEACALDEYWRRQDFSIRLNLGLVTSGADIPAKPSVFSDEAARMPRAAPREETEPAVEALLTEALRSKQWTIPRGARVQLPIGPFVEAEFTELSKDVAITLRTALGEYYYVGIEPAKLFWAFEPSFADSFDSDTAESICGAVRLLLAAVVRDFWVVEQRESVFAVREQPLVGRQRQVHAEPRIVYLPRARYSQRADVSRCAADLGHAHRREHAVGAHLRKASRSGSAQRALAEVYGFAVPQGYTFVRPHERGHLKREVVYRSRSALRSLYEVDDEAPRTTVRWFEFERDVRDALIGLGFEVEHVAASRRGDRGVDVYAKKGSGLDEVCWVIQCKCWSPARKVGPDVVRELLGALEGYPKETRGMIVTTSTFTAGAITDAARAGVRLMSGEEFLSLRQTKK